MAKFILNGQEYGGGSGGSNVIKLTQAEYDALPNDKLSDDNIQLITDSGELTAENLFYDGSTTGLGNNVQDAIDELNSNIDEYYHMLSKKISALEQKVFRGITSDNGEIPYSDWYYEGTDYNIPVTFNSAFTSIPKITFSFSGQELDTTITANANNITTTGFNIELSVSQDDKFAIYWTATID